MTTKYPKNGIWKQENLGDKFGTIARSVNLNLADEQGKLRLSPRLLINTSITDDAQLAIAPFAIVFNPNLDKWHMGTDAVMFVGGDAPNESFTQDAASTPPSFTTTARPDLAVFAASNGDFYTFVMAAELYRLALDGTSWGSALTSLGGALNGAPLIPFKNRLYFRVGKSSMGSINQALNSVATPTATNALALNDNTQEISCGKASSNNIYLGTIAQFGQKAYVVEWNGSSTSATRIIPVDAQGVLSLVIWNGIPWIFDSNGVLSYLNGSTFTPAARLPFKSYKPLKTIISGNHTTFLCHYNGMVVDGDKLYINLNTSYSDGTTDEMVPSGIWLYTVDNGFHHYLSPTNNKSSDTITDYGSTKVSAVGALAIAKTSDSDSNGSILAGISILSDATTAKPAIFYNDTDQTLQAGGSIILSRIYSENIRERWQKFYAPMRKFLNSGDKFVLKVRTSEDTPVEATITWTSTTQFTTTTNVSAYNPTTLGYNPEVEILNGIGAGKCAHITAISEAGGTYTVTVDETFTSASGTAKGRFQTWRKIGTFNSQTEDVPNFPLSDAPVSLMLDVKIYFQWTGKNEIFSILIAHKGDNLIE